MTTVILRNIFINKYEFIKSEKIIISFMILQILNKIIIYKF